MKIAIELDSKEIAALVSVFQEQHKKDHFVPCDSDGVRDSCQSNSTAPLSANP